MRLKTALEAKSADGLRRFLECFDQQHNTCPINGSCLLKSALAQAESAFYETLDRHTLRDLVTGSAGKGMKEKLLPQQ